LRLSLRLGRKKVAQNNDSRYGAAQLASFGALKGSSLGHY
jgi:hypothetical protein